MTRMAQAILMMKSLAEGDAGRGPEDDDEDDDDEVVVVLVFFPFLVIVGTTLMLSFAISA